VFATFVQASEDCNSLRPDWKLPGTNCSIDPYYYEVTLVRDDIFDCECSGDNDHDYDRHGTSTEYITGYFCHYGDSLPDVVNYYNCKNPEYSCDYSSHDTTDPNFVCNDTHPRYGCWMFCLECSDSYDTCTSDGAWQVPEGSENGEPTQFKRLFSWTDSGTHDGNKDWTREYSEELTIDAIFEKPTDPNCYDKPVVRYSKYAPTVNVMAKDGDSCCVAGSPQVIDIWCTHGSHVKDVKVDTEGDTRLATYTEEEDIPACDNSDNGRCKGAHISFILSPNNNIIDWEKDSKLKITVTCDFYDSAGNACGAGKVQVNFKLTCPPQSKG
jgi:hypothetical protein